MDNKLTFSNDSVEGLRNRLHPGQLELFESGHFQVDISNVALLDQLAKGSYGVVYRCSLNGNSYAVKIEDFLPGIEEQVNLLVELSILQSLPHDRLVPFFGAGYLSKSGASAYKVMIVMELCQYGALREGLQYNLPWSLRVRLALDTAEGLAFLHENNIVHRDIKTTNVLIDGNWRAKLCDFSFACHANCVAKRAFIYGTDEFMSPEIAMGDDFDCSSDIFSFGVLLCEVITKREPSSHFLHREAKTLFELNAEELRAAIPSDCPESLEALVLQCCSLNPAERPNAQECCEWLQGLLEELGGGEDIDFNAQSLTAMQPSSPEREGHVKYPRTQDLSFIRNAKAVRNGSDSSSRLAFLEVQVQELRAENRRLNREMNVMTQPDRRRVSDSFYHTGPRKSLVDLSRDQSPSPIPIPMNILDTLSPAQLRASTASLTELLNDIRDRLSSLEDKVLKISERVPPSSSTSFESNMETAFERELYLNEHGSGNDSHAGQLQSQLADLQEELKKINLRVDQIAPSANSSTNPTTPTVAYTTSKAITETDKSSGDGLHRSNLEEMVKIEQAMRSHVELFSVLLKTSSLFNNSPVNKTTPTTCEVSPSVTELNESFKSFLSVVQSLADESVPIPPTVDQELRDQISPSDDFEDINNEHLDSVSDLSKLKSQGRSSNIGYGGRTSIGSVYSDAPDIDGINATWKDVDDHSEAPSEVEGDGDIETDGEAQSPADGVQNRGSPARIDDEAMGISTPVTASFVTLRGSQRRTSALSQEVNVQQQHTQVKISFDDEDVDAL